MRIFSYNDNDKKGWYHWIHLLMNGKNFDSQSELILL